MALDMFFKNLDVELIVNWLTTNQIRAIIEDIRAFDENDDLILDQLSTLPGQVYNKIFPANTVPLRPGPGLDPNAWVQLRLLNEVEAFDFSGDPDEDLDRWKHSKTVTISSANATESVVDNITQWEKIAGPHAGIIIMRGSEMQAEGKMFHYYLGGNGY